MAPARLRSAGAQMLRDYIHYCQSGGTDLGMRTRPSVELNAFERDVRSQLTAAGLDLECQVGASGFWIDFAAKHPTDPGRYVLAVEADGGTYHSSQTARDRDRLRQHHLERLGWKFHRIWSTTGSTTVSVRSLVPWLPSRRRWPNLRYSPTPHHRCRRHRRRHRRDEAARGPHPAQALEP
jgi:very-short-patch-repair endonuclease